MHANVKRDWSYFVAFVTQAFVPLVISHLKNNPTYFNFDSVAMGTEFCGTYITLYSSCRVLLGISFF
jgi:uncharacterized membrane protein